MIDSYKVGLCCVIYLHTIIIFILSQVLISSMVKELSCVWKLHKTKDSICHKKEKSQWELLTYYSTEDFRFINNWLVIVQYLEIEKGILDS